MKRVLVVADGPSGQNRSALAAVRALAAARSYDVHVTVSTRFSLAARSRCCDRRIDMPAIDDPRYAPAVRALLADGSYAAVFPASDAALLALGWPGGELVDKREVARRAAAAGFPAVREQVYGCGAELLDHAKELHYPVAVKVAAKAAGDAREVRRADVPADLVGFAAVPGAIVVQEWLTGSMRAVAGVVWRGRLRAVAHQAYTRIWPRQCGVACAAVTVESDGDLEERIVGVLDGYDGVFQAQLLGRYLVDLNPRVYGSMPLALAAGLNLPDLVCRLLAGERVAGVESFRARPGVRYRWLEGDLRHVLQAVRCGDMTWRQAARTLRPSAGTAHGDVSLADPVPTLVRLHYALGARR